MLMQNFEGTKMNNMINLEMAYLNCANNISKLCAHRSETILIFYFGPCREELELSPKAWWFQT